MSKLLDSVEKVHNILKDYQGENPYMQYLQKLSKTSSLNALQKEFVIRNQDFKPVEVNKIVKIADWWGKYKQQDWNLEFIPEKIKITWYLGDTSEYYVFYCFYRQSQSSAALCFAPKTAIITQFLMNDYTLLNIDFLPYSERSGRVLRSYQEDGVKFLTQQKKGILADEPGAGKTSTAIVASLVGGYEHILIISPASVKKTWEKELSLYVDKEDITIVEGSTWKDAKYTIINYDILDNYYTIPTQTIKSKEYVEDDNGNLTVEYKDKEIISRSQKIINKAMSESQLFQAKFDLIIIDEAHRLSNSTSNRSKIMVDFIKRLSPKGIFELTGTPITNRPINLFNLLRIIDSPLAADWKTYVFRYCDGKSFFNKKQRDVISGIFIKQHGKSSWYDLSYGEKQELNDLLEKKCKKVWVTNGCSNLDELQELLKPCYLRRESADFGKMPKKTVKLLKYELTPEDKAEYKTLWEQYVGDNSESKAIEELEKYKKITETTILRQWVARHMLPKTIELAKQCVEEGNKIIIFCAYDEEVNTLKEHFGDIAVYHNGKLNMKQKEEAVVRFQTDDSIKVFIGNIQSAGVGLTLTAAHISVFNSFSFVPGDNEQCENRIHRLSQTKDCTVYYQIFNNTFFEEMFDKVKAKEEIINKIIVTEKEK